jgi:hypothetical protein
MGHVAAESVDLVYLDPPFNSDRTYNLIYKGSQAQERAFVDTWTWDDSADASFRELTDRSPQGVHVPTPLREMMRALKVFLGAHTDMLAYLSMMAIRLVEMRRVLRKTASIYVHCDATASHYLACPRRHLRAGEFSPRDHLAQRVGIWIQNEDVKLGPQPRHIALLSPRPSPGVYVQQGSRI